MDSLADRHEQDLLYAGNACHMESLQGRAEVFETHTVYIVELRK